MNLWPESIQPESCTFGRSRNDAAQESPVTRVRQIHRRGRPVWTASINWKVQPRQVSEARFQIESAYKELASTLLRDYGAPRVTRTEDVKVNTAAAIGDTSVSSKGWTVSVTGVVAAGQYIQIGHRLYTVSAAANSNGSGIATISLRTPIVEPALANDVIEIRAPACAMRPTSTDWMGSRSWDEGLWSVSAEFSERIF